MIRLHTSVDVSLLPSRRLAILYNRQAARYWRREAEKDRQAGRVEQAAEAERYAWQFDDAADRLEQVITVEGWAA